MPDESENSGTRYLINSSRSEFTVQAFAAGLLSFAGHSPTFAVRRYGGKIQFASGSQKVDSLLIAVQADSLVLLDDVNDADAVEIKSTLDEEVLETARFPEIVFVSRDISLERISGNLFYVQANGYLSLHGETRQKTIEAEAEINGENIRAVGKFTLCQSDFNIKQVKALGGTLKVKDEVKVSFDIKARI